MNHQDKRKVLHLNQRQIDMDLQDDENFAAFRNNILPHTCNVGIFFCGSFYEQPLEYAMLNLTDLDNLFFDRKFIAATETATISNYFEKEIFTIETKNCHLGYARLIRRSEKKTEYFERSRKFLHGPAIKNRIMTMLQVRKVFRDVQKCKPELNLQDFKRLDADYVYCVLCPHWPQEAAEWRTRERRRGWPTKDMIETIVKGGCHLVPKSHQSNPKDDTVWRFSFSQAELILVNSWNEIQTYIYHILRLLKSRVIAKCGGEKKTFLCTYFFKTLMLWACEEKPSDFWSQNRIETTIEQLLLQMVQWLINNNCPNYFIRGYNMLDYMKPDLDESKEAKLLLKLIGRKDISKVIARQPKVDHDKVYNVLVSDKSALVSQLALNRKAFLNAMNQKLGRYALKNLSSSPLLSHEVEHLFRAVQSHRLLMSDLSSGDEELSEKRKTNETDALRNFHISYKKKGTGSYADVVVSSQDSLSCTANKVLHSKRMYCNRLSDGSDSTSEPMEALFKSLVEIVDNNQLEPSFLISAAYYANFYYTGLRDYRQAIKMCKETKAAVKASKDLLSANTIEPAFSNEILCVFINRQYIDIHDAGIQAVYGFLTLCMTIIGQNEERDLVLQVCPVEFLDYIRIRCRNTLSPDSKKSFHVTHIERATGLRQLSNAILSAAFRC